MTDENKTRKSNGKGGKRPGAGRPKSRKPRNREVINISNDMKNDIFLELQQRVEDGQRSFAQLLVDMAYNRATPPSLKICALKLISEAITVKEEKTTSEVNTSAVVILPEIKTPEDE
jgi:hypothetical protein